MEGFEVPTNGSIKHPPSITIYTTPHCHWCKVAKSYFAEKGLPYREIDVTKRGSGRREMMLLTGSTAVPVIKVGSHAMTGWDTHEFEKLLSGKFKRR